MGNRRLLREETTIYQLRKVLAPDRQLKRAFVIIPDSAQDKPQEGKEATQAFLRSKTRESEAPLSEC
jgi:hypothetical protein